MTASSLTDLLADLRLALSGARAAAASGAPIDLIGLDDEIARLTDAALLAPLAERVAILSVLEALLRDIDGIDFELRRSRDLDIARRAANAYAGGDAS